MKHNRGKKEKPREQHPQYGVRGLHPQYEVIELPPPLPGELQLGVASRIIRRKKRARAPIFGIFLCVLIVVSVIASILKIFL